MSSSDYRNIHIPFENRGLDLVHPPDMVPPGKWTRLTNVRSTQEGILQTREGTSSFVVGIGAGNTIFIRRMDTSTLLIQAGTELYRNATLISTGWQNFPITAVRFKPALDTANWMYVTDGVKMRKIRADGTEFQWGITPPGAALIFGASGAGDLDSSVAGATDYDWRATYFSSITGAESNSTPTAPGISCVNQSANIALVASTDPQVDGIRLYRRGGTIPTQWKLVTTLSNVNQVYTDGAADSTLRFSLTLDTNKDQPFTTVDSAGNILFGTALPTVWGPFIGQYILACGDPNRPGFVYWTNSGDPDSASSFNNVQVTSPAEALVNGFIYDANVYVFSRDNLFTLDFGGPNVQGTFFIPRRIPLGFGLSAKYALTTGGPGGVTFLSKDGIYLTDCTNSINSLTDDIRPIFRGIAANGFQPVDYAQENSIRMEYVGMELHFFYKDTLGSLQHIFYDINYKRWQQHIITDHTVFMGYGDENQPGYRLLLGGTTGNVYQGNVVGSYIDVGSTPISGNARTYSDAAGIPLTFKEFGDAIIDIDTQGTDVIVTPYYNSEQVTGTAETVNAATRDRLPISLQDTYGYSVAFDLSWQGLVRMYGIELLWRDDEEAVKHWECPPTSHELPGWQHIRDGYIGIRSAADVTMTINIDGVDFTYTVPSTGGARRKVYMEFRPVKGKMFQYKFDSTGLFRLYGEDTQLNIKSWQTALGYKPVYPFPAAGYAGFARKDAGT